MLTIKITLALLTTAIYIRNAFFTAATLHRKCCDVGFIIGDNLRDCVQSNDERYHGTLENMNQTFSTCFQGL